MIPVNQLDQVKHHRNTSSCRLFRGEIAIIIAACTALLAILAALIRLSKKGAILGIPKHIFEANVDNSIIIKVILRNSHSQIPKIYSYF